MEWVETTGKTVEEAKGLALDRLGVHEGDAEFEVLEEPRPGLFGRVRGEARVRARVMPTTPRPKVERRDRRKKETKPEAPGDTKPEAPARKKSERQVSDSTSTASGSAESSGSALVSSGTAPERAAMPRPTAADVAVEAEKFVAGLLAALGVEGTSTVDRDGDELEVRVEGPDLGVLIGPRGTTLLAVQDLVRVASQRRIGDHDTRLRLDINGYREKRREALARFALAQADEVVASGEARSLEAMPSADRKVIHDALSVRTDVSTRSEGEDPARRVVIVPSGSPD